MNPLPEQDPDILGAPLPGLVLGAVLVAITLIVGMFYIAPILVRDSAVPPSFILVCGFVFGVALGALAIAVIVVCRDRPSVNRVVHLVETRQDDQIAAMFQKALKQAKASGSFASEINGH